MSNSIETAQAFAAKHGYDSAEKIAEKNCFDYFLLTAERLKGKKCGLPPVLKIRQGKTHVIPVERLDELMWAINQPR